MPGMAYSLRISFQPVKLEACKDVIEVTVAGDTFPIYMEALLPIMRLEVPKTIDFGLCAVAEVCFTELPCFQAQSLLCLAKAMTPCMFSRPFVFFMYFCSCCQGD